MRLGSLFSGYGGLDMAVENVTGATTAWVSDIDKGACKILAHRYPDVPNLGDISTVDWSQVEPVDVLTGGFPCQDLSHAGKRAGMRPDTRAACGPTWPTPSTNYGPDWSVAENVRGLLSASAHSDVEPCPWCVGRQTQAAICGHSEPFSEVWPTSGMTRAGMAYALPTSEHRMDDSGSSLLPTPTTDDAEDSLTRDIGRLPIADPLRWR